ncbi:hypothetical protein FOA43_003114 [Brettanomyces nanus]|uniref:DUF1748 domain-containing protein n=1 Tax=Eeniella nana TaxID=13502 RepID=A0A875S9N1_EENNA|nr:uncharacterized protein FOA43_003114 [Brettanomyces nanus]QPG75754.1 hypothetical protein FOA43_003114 [Brettanomyces nanus]
MSLGKLFHYSFDIVVISIILAGIKSSTGYELRVDSIAHTKDSISILRKYLNLGETLFSRCCSYAKSSKSFRMVMLPGTQQVKDAVNDARKKYDKRQ